MILLFFFFSSRRRHTRSYGDWSSDVCSSDLEVGRDGDLVVVDPRNIEAVTAKRVRYKCGWTPFEGMEGCFPRTVYLRGEAIIDDGEAISDGQGRLIGGSS